MLKVTINPKRDFPELFDQAAAAIADANQKYAVDDRQCGECRHYSPHGRTGICRRHLMWVTPEMHVTYEVAQGSCHEPVEGQV